VGPSGFFWGRAPFFKAPRKAQIIPEIAEIAGLGFLPKSLRTGKTPAGGAFGKSISPLRGRSARKFGPQAFISRHTLERSSMTQVGTLFGKWRRFHTVGLFGACGLLILVAFLITAVRQSRGDAQPMAGLSQSNSQIAWFHDLYEAHKASVATGRPMLIVFGADWCRYCRELDTKTLTNPNLAAYVSRYFIPVHLNTDHDKRVAEIFKAKPIPCTVVLSPSAVLISRTFGYEEPRPYFVELEKSRQQYVHMQVQHQR
jgi:thiol-disulfide isomerase/thioredoxin